MLLPCIICGEELESAMKSKPEINQPYEGTVFFTYGHYGSTVFDPQSPTNRIRLEITVCDSCLIERKNRTTIVVHERKIQESYHPWDPSRDY